MPAPALRDLFAERIRDRGLELAEAGAVQLERLDPGIAIATVEGGAPYRTSIEVRGPGVALACTCPHAEGGAYCKHLWATLLTLDETPAAAALLAALADVRSAHLVAGMVRTTDPVTLWLRLFDRVALRQLTEAANATETGTRRGTRQDWPVGRRLVYVIDGNDPNIPQLRLEVLTEKQLRDGSWEAPRRGALAAELWQTAPDPRDRAIRRLLLGAAPLPEYGTPRTTFPLAPQSVGDILPAICATGRARLRLAGEPPVYGAVQWDEQAGTSESTLVPWRVALVVEPDEAQGWRLTGALQRGEEQRSFTDVQWMHESGLCLVANRLAPVELGAFWPLVAELLHVRALPLGPSLTPVLERVYALPQVPAVVLPPDHAIRESHLPPKPGVRFVPDPEPWVRRAGGPMLGLQLAFRYGEASIDATDPASTRFDAATRTLHHRDRDAERDARDRFVAFGGAGAREALARGVPFRLPRSEVRRAVAQLANDGWWLETDGHAFRLPGAVQARVRSGPDWFDLEGTVVYDDTTVSLADVLEARRRGADVVQLLDGSIGLLPDEWLDAFGPVLAGGERTATGARFRASQLALLDALLATLPDVDVDATFAKAREALSAFDHIQPADPSPAFTGTLRPYQREGLGWLHFLRAFGFGGCLADDMGLGKTIQVLALLDARRAEGHGPSLVVVPRSLVFNWRAEAARFAPALRVADWSGGARDTEALNAQDVDLAIITYGSLRRDAAQLAGIAFDYVVLDEAQAIKNRGTATAKACRVLQASHRLALSGTPIENRLDELWSLLDFLNPGMLGPSSRFTASLREASDERVVDAVLSRALRPVILRRTKAAVAPDLPPRIERTLEVELEPKQRAFYDQLHRTVRDDVLQQVNSKGLGRSKLHILEGLLRLRQAACHPVLADPGKRTLPSAKLDALIPALADVAAEGNKALVFSQFTGFLALVRAALDAEQIPYEYLDGRTKDREARVARFQNDPTCPVFLISLKAGGHGLNLTAADYVYLLDPWWNPAVEAQAIDRAHRIGRTRQVIATRLVARGTVEEKILTLQASKRALADAILSADRGGLASIGREELELLLG